MLSRERDLTSGPRSSGTFVWLAIGLAGFLSLGFLSAVIGLFGPLASLAGSLGRVGIIAAGFLIANPVVALIAAIAAAAVLLYFHWDEVVKFLKISWFEIKEMFSGIGDFFGGIGGFLGGFLGETSLPGGCDR